MLYVISWRCRIRNQVNEDLSGNPSLFIYYLPRTACALLVTMLLYLTAGNTKYRQCTSDVGGDEYEPLSCLGSTSVIAIKKSNFYILHLHLGRPKTFTLWASKNVRVFSGFLFPDSSYEKEMSMLWVTESSTWSFVWFWEYKPRVHIGPIAHNVLWPKVI